MKWVLIITCVFGIIGGIAYLSELSELPTALIAAGFCASVLFYTEMHKPSKRDKK